MLLIKIKTKQKVRIVVKEPERKGQNGRTGREIKEGKNEHKANVLYTCPKLPKNKFNQ